MIQVCQEHNIRDYAIAFNAVPMEGEDINLYDMLEVLRAEYVGAMIPYDEDVLTYTQDGHLLELVSTDLTSVLAPLVDYCCYWRLLGRLRCTKAILMIM